MAPARCAAKAADEEKKITAALTEVKQYTSTAIPTADYKPIVEEKTQVLGKDVNTAWKTLYDRQAPLLTWPETVRERFRKWGRKWPEKEDPGRVNLAIVDYIEAYKPYVAMVYKTFKPFDYETGTGIVAAPPQDALLRPSVFQVEHLPSLGKIWSAQERLWMQRTVLEVVAEVNKNAKSWDDAIVKQIERLEVGNPTAQDQRSIAKGEQLEPAAEIYAPGEEEAAAAASAGAGAGVSGSGGSAAAMAGQMMMGGLKGRGDGAMSMGGSMGMMMGGGGGGATGKEGETVYYVKYDNDKGQYKVLPILITVLIDQDHIQDFLVELENSPMSIQVMDIELNRPESRVTKPEKGDVVAGGIGAGMMGSMAGMMMRMRGGEPGAMARGMTGYGGMMGAMQGQMAMSARMGGGRMGEMGMGKASTRKGTDVRNIDREKKRKEKEKAINQVKGPSLFDPHFDIVQVTVYGQARFFNPPPVDEQAEPSLGDTATAAGASGGTPAKAPTPAAPPASAAPAAGGAPSAAPATGSAEAKQPGAASQPPAATAKTGAAAKAETPKPDTPKPDAKKADSKSAAPKS